MVRSPIPRYIERKAPAHSTMIDALNTPRASQAPTTTAEYRFTGTMDPQLHDSDDPSLGLYTPRKMSTASTGRSTTGTQDLAEFLKSSRPEDYGRVKRNVSPEEVEKPKRRFFLKSNVAKDPVEKARPKPTEPLLLPHVVTKTRSRRAQPAGTAAPNT